MPLSWIIKFLSWTFGVFSFPSREPEDAEVTENISNRGRIGNLQLSTQDITDLVAFLNTLTDGAF